MNDLVSVVMATYNGDQFIRLQIESILNQSYLNLEIIVVDDASSDNTLAILKEYANADARISIYKNDVNIGFIANFERGLMLAKGEYIALSDQDDIFDTNKIEMLINALKASNGCDLVCSDLRLIDEEGNLIANSMWKYANIGAYKKRYDFHRLVYSNYVTGCSMMMTRRLCDRSLPFPADCLVHDWWLAVIATSKNFGGICFVNEPLISYRQHGGNVIGVKVGGANLVKTIKSFNARDRRLDHKNFLIKTIPLHLNRLQSYLTTDIFTPREINIINQVHSFYFGYLTDTGNRLDKQIAKLPSRIRYAVLSSKLSRRILSSIYYCIFPLK